MLIIERLRAGEPLAAVAAELALKVAEHPDGRVILNYDPVFSPKADPTARECRGLCLDRSDGWRPAARAFPRFFNAGEFPEEDAAFGWASAVTAEKVDGSLALLYAHRGAWRVNTRGSFADGRAAETGRTWADLFRLALGRDHGELELDPGLTYAFELCTPWTQVVALHPAPCLYLLAAVRTDTGEELPDGDADAAADRLGVRRPKRYTFADHADVRAYLADAGLHPTFEGFVVRDAAGRRLKCKNPRYVELHALKGNGNLLLTKNVVPLILAGEAAEVLAYFPDAARRFAEVGAVLAAAEAEMLGLWDRVKDEPSQKAFATAVAGAPLAGVLFQARKLGRDPATVLRASPDYVLKALFRDAG